VTNFTYWQFLAIQRENIFLSLPNSTNIAGLKDHEKYDFIDHWHIPKNRNHSWLQKWNFPCLGIL
jgi:hypothetical protein